MANEIRKSILLTRMHSSRMRTVRPLLYRGSLSGVVSFRGGLCPGASLGGLCSGRSLSGGPLSGGSLSRGVSVQRVFVWGVLVQGSLSGDLCLGDLCSGGLCPGGSLSRVISVGRGSLSRGIYVGRGLCPGGHPNRDSLRQKPSWSCDLWRMLRQSRPPPPPRKQNDRQV